MSHAQIYERDGGVCFFCGKTLSLEESTIEHLLAVAHGGKDNAYNLTIACQPCNRNSGAKAVIEKVKIREANLFPIFQRKPTIKAITVAGIRIEVEQ
jgi:5-methylcytosine-specific restriction endonuclease McrA